LLNRYPGPMHALEHGKALLTLHKERARALGERVVLLERELDGLFASGKADAASVDRLTSAIGEANGKLRAEHLKTHLETTRMLTLEQVAKYNEARGYQGGAAHKH
jgi:hypothetical protein